MRESRVSIFVGLVGWMFKEKETRGKQAYPGKAGLSGESRRWSKGGGKTGTGESGKPEKTEARTYEHGMSDVIRSSLKERAAPTSCSVQYAV